MGGGWLYIPTFVTIFMISYKEHLSIIFPYNSILIYPTPPANQTIKRRLATYKYSLIKRTLINNIPI